ncbi:MAG: hypothetical protein E6K60_06030 [Nitrospirae bacterium]|nr:MAG: hypothetical protein E6K60_06030 [Nitrospirota bacterium]
MVISIRQKEIIRGKILYYLALIYPRSATLPLLQGELDIFGYHVPMDELSFHVAYLADKGFIEVENVRGPTPRRKLALVKVTARGIDYYDGRLPEDDGIYLEPRSREFGTGE